MSSAAALPEPRAALPELAAVPWRKRASAESLKRRESAWALWMALYSIPFFFAGAFLLALEPLSAPAALASFAHGWIIPELYVSRGAAVVRPKAVAGLSPDGSAEPVAQGLLGDLLDHDARALQRSTGLAIERGELGVWLVGEAGALLVPPGAKRVHSFCVRATDKGLPPSDRIAHLLLALRTDECGFATVANHAFARRPRRLRRRLGPRMRPALRAALEAARADSREAPA